MLELLELEITSSCELPTIWWLEVEPLVHVSAPPIILGAAWFSDVILFVHQKLDHLGLRANKSYCQIYYRSLFFLFEMGFLTVAGLI